MRGTFTRGGLTDIGAFGACYSLAGWKKLALIRSADGVGAKIKAAFLRPPCSRASASNQFGVSGEDRSLTVGMPG